MSQQARRVWEQEGKKRAKWYIPLKTGAEQENKTGHPPGWLTHGSVTLPLRRKEKKKKKKSVLTITRLCLAADLLRVRQ